MSNDQTRRTFLRTAAVGVGLAAAGLPRWAGAADAMAEPEISPAEDLMREHGAIERMLLVYEEVARRLDARTAVQPEPIAATANIIRRFVEEYHEKLEEEQVFPRLRKAQATAKLIPVLLDQHEAGRRATTEVLRLTKRAAFNNPDMRRQLADLLRQYIGMYRPHAAREDTVAFPAFNEAVPDAERRKLGDAFEEREREMFGDMGFERIVKQTAEVEQEMGIGDLAKFTIHLPASGAANPAK